MPRVSIIMNCYNGERYLKEAIDSVFAQTYSDWEIVFWDNASTDRSAEIARSYHGARLRYFRAEKTIPLGPARNLAIDRAKGDWLAFVDCDDVSFPQRLKRQMSAVAGGDYVMSSAGIRDVTEDGKKIRDIMPRYRSGYIFPQLLEYCDLWLQTTMVNRSALQRLNIRINEECQTSEDYNLFMRLAAKGDVCIVPEILSTCRIVSNSLTNMTVERHSIERFLTLDQIKAENPGIETRYATGFKKAEARGRYYRAKHLLDIGDGHKARIELKMAGQASVVYLLLFVLSHWPALWKFMHDRRLRSKVSGMLLVGKIGK